MMAVTQAQSQITSLLRYIDREGLSNCARSDVELTSYNSFRIKAIARIMFCPRHQMEAAKVLNFCQRTSLTPFVLGGGTNVLIVNQVLPLVISMGHLKEIRFNNNTVYTGAGFSLPGLVKQTVQRGLAGMEVLVGIPGTVGGAIVGNAGSCWQNQQITVSTFVKEIHIVDNNGSIRSIPKSAVRFGYRYSSLTENIIVGAAFQLRSSVSVAELRERMQMVLRQKVTSQPLGAQSAGCVFKNPPGTAAWKLICRAGLPGTRVGAAMVSKKHANFIVNLGGASGKDVLYLIRLVQKRVRQLCGIDLDLEVKIWEANDLIQPYTGD